MLASVFKISSSYQLCMSLENCAWNSFFSWEVAVVIPAVEIIACISLGGGVLDGTSALYAKNTQRDVAEKSENELCHGVKFFEMLSSP